jgi:hypothetical protein
MTQVRSVKAKLTTMTKRPIVMTPEESIKRFPAELKANNRCCALDDEYEKVMKRLLRAAGRKEDKPIVQLARQLYAIEQENQKLMQKYPWIIDGGWSRFLRQHNIVLKEA